MNGHSAASFLLTSIVLAALLFYSASLVTSQK
jgi:hypothetical protein